MIKYALASCAMIGLLATPLSLSAADKQSKEKTAMKGRVPIVAASRLLDKTVYDMKGRNTGEIEYLLIDAQSGDVRYALVSLEDSDEERFVPIPWRALSTSRWSDGLRVRAEKAYLQKSQRYTQEEIAEITQPTVMTSVVGRWVATQLPPGA